MLNFVRASFRSFPSQSAPHFQDSYGQRTQPNPSPNSNSQIKGAAKYIRS